MITIDSKQKDGKKIDHIKMNRMKAGAALLISDKGGFRTRTVSRNKGRPCIMIKGLIHTHTHTKKHP